MLRDAPIAFGPFTPENFDGRSSDRSRRGALIAAATCRRCGCVATEQPSLYQFLQSAGVRD
jgi:penicillin-binding protein 1C